MSAVFTTQLIEFTSNLEQMYKSYLVPTIVDNTIFFGNSVSPENDFLAKFEFISIYQ